MKRFLLGLIGFAALAVPVTGVLYGTAYLWFWANGRPPREFWEMIGTGCIAIVFTLVGLVLLAAVLSALVIPIGDAIMKVGGTIDDVVKDQLEKRETRRWMAQQKEETAKQKRGSVSVVDDDAGAISISKVPGRGKRSQQ